MTPTLRIAVAGAGRIGKRHVQMIVNDDGCALSALVDPAPGAGDYAGSLGVPLYASLGELFARDRPDGVVLATPNQLHVDQALECIAARVPTLVEKPIAHTLEAGIALCKAAEAANVPVLVGHHRRHSSTMAKAIEIVASGALGTFMLSDTAASDRSWEHTSGEDPRYANAHTDDDDCYLVCGTFGSLAIPTMRLARYPGVADRSWHKPLDKSTIELDVVDPLARQIAHFADVIRGKAAPLVSARDGLQNLRVVGAIVEAAKTRRVV